MFLTFDQLGTCMDINIDVNIDEDEIRNAVVDKAEQEFRKAVENDISNGKIVCDCGSRSFDVETWKVPNGAIEGAAVCRSCNERLPVEIDTEELDNLR